MFRGPSGKLVKLHKLAKQARRDLLANPKKAAILGLMLLVALYFWGPLLWKWFAPAGGKKGSKDQAGLILEDDPAQAADKAKTGVAAAGTQQRRSRSPADGLRALAIRTE